jgi:hypothetical protein
VVAVLTQSPRRRPPRAGTASHTAGPVRQLRALTDHASQLAPARPNLVVLPGGRESGPTPLRLGAAAPAQPAPADAVPVSEGHPPRLVPIAPVPGPVSRIGRAALQYWRIVASVVALVAVIGGGWLLLRAMGGVAGGGSLASSGAPASPAAFPGTAPAGAAPAGAVGASGSHPIPGRIWVVQPGDTPWGIVAAAGISGDPRPVVDQLVAETGGRPLQVGQAIRVP